MGAVDGHCSLSPSASRHPISGFSVSAFSFSRQSSAGQRTVARSICAFFPCSNPTPTHADTSCHTLSDADTFSPTFRLTSFGFSQRSVRPAALISIILASAHTSFQDFSFPRFSIFLQAATLPLREMASAAGTNSRRACDFTLLQFESALARARTPTLMPAMYGAEHIHEAGTRPPRCSSNARSRRPSRYSAHTSTSPLTRTSRFHSSLPRRS